MKTSFYFVLWILIYPILSLFNNSVVENHAFFFALLAVYGFSWIINRVMPSTLLYERVTGMAPILEDVYTGNVGSFAKRLGRDALIETVTAIYFLIATAVSVLIVFKLGINDWLALVVFGILTIGAMVRSAKLVNAHFKLKSNPTPEQCMEIAEENYGLDYTAYYESRIQTNYAGMLPPRPKYYKAFQIFSIVIASVAILLGVWYIISGTLIMTYGGAVELGAVAGMYFLYGSLATYFGARDIITIGKAMRRRAGLVETV